MQGGGGLLTPSPVYGELSQLVPRPDVVSDLSIGADVGACGQHSHHLGSHGYILGHGDGIVSPLKDWSVVIHIQHQNGEVDL